MQPNVVFIIADQHRWDFVGYEPEANGVTFTPHLDALAARGTVCSSCYCTAPLCSPSRAALASGRYGVNSGCFTNLHELPPDSPSFVSQFRTAGYRTSMVGKCHMSIHHYQADYGSASHLGFMDSLGWDDVCEISGNGMLKTGIRDHYTRFLNEHAMFDAVLEYYRRWIYFMDPEPRGDSPYAPHVFELDERFHETRFVGDRAVDWLQQRDRSRPFLLHVGFAAPHAPIEPVSRLLERYLDLPEPTPWGLDDNGRFAAARRGYRAMITEIDEQVGRLVEVVERQGLLEDTIFVYTADHGEMAGDLGLTDKTVFFEGAERIPLVLAGPGVEAGRNTALIEHLDLGKSLCELCGVEPHAWDQGRSLRPLLAGDTATHRETVYAEMGCDRMLRDRRYKLMWGDPRRDQRKLGRLHLDKPVNIPPSAGRLYDLQTDPHELNDLIDSPAHQGVLAGLLARLLARCNENVQTQPFLSRGEYRPL